MSDARKIADTDVEASGSELRDKLESRRASDRIIIGTGESFCW